VDISAARPALLAVVGASGLGSPAAETIYRMAVNQLGLIDHNVLDTPSNLRRMQGTRNLNLRATAPPREGRPVVPTGCSRAVRLPSRRPRWRRPTDGPHRADG
jgi:hypothetical protein